MTTTPDTTLEVIFDSKRSSQQQLSNPEIATLLPRRPSDSPPPQPDHGEEHWPEEDAPSTNTLANPSSQQLANKEIYDHTLANPSSQQLANKEIYDHTLANPSSQQLANKEIYDHTRLTQQFQQQSTNNFQEEEEEGIEDEEYLKLIQSLMEVQGVDFDEWKAQVITAAEEEYYHDGSSSWGSTNNSDATSNKTESSSRETTGEANDDEEEEDDISTQEEEPIAVLSNEAYFGGSRNTGKDDLSPLMGMKSFRYLETKVLAKFLMKTDDERMNDLRVKIKRLKKVKPPDTFNLNSESVKSKDTLTLRSGNKYSPEEEGNNDDEEEDEEEESPWGDAQLNNSLSDIDIDAEPKVSLPLYNLHIKIQLLIYNPSLTQGAFDYSPEQWALKNAYSFLHHAGCASPPVSDTGLTIPPEERTPRLKVFLDPEIGQGNKHRSGIGTAEAAPEITAALKRRAERAFLRALLRNSKPKYPLPRFILPEFRYLKKIEASLIGPGSYEIEQLYEQERLKRLNAHPSHFKSCTSRFEKDKTRASAASESHGDPWARWDAACEHSRHPGKVPLFQSPPCNFRYKNFYIGCGIPPNAYNIPSPLQQFLNKKQSNRSLFEGSQNTSEQFCPRNNTDFLASTLRGPGAYDVRTSLLKTLGDRYNIFKGKISATPRRKIFGFRAAFDKPLWPIDNGFPGPATYDPYENEQWIESSWAPFDIQDKARKLQLNTQSKLVAPDYYFYDVPARNANPRWKPQIIGDGCRSDFVSGSPMSPPEERYFALKERNQALNFKFDQQQRDKKKDEQRTCTC
jgi:hypothetical protein